MEKPFSTVFMIRHKVVEISLSNAAWQCFGYKRRPGGFFSRFQSEVETKQNKRLIQEISAVTMYEFYRQSRLFMPPECSKSIVFGIIAMLTYGDDEIAYWKVAGFADPQEAQGFYTNRINQYGRSSELEELVTAFTINAKTASMEKNRERFGAGAYAFVKPSNLGIIVNTYLEELNQTSDVLKVTILDCQELIDSQKSR